MRRIARAMLLTAATVFSSTAFSADIQQVAASCTTEGCCNMKDCNQGCNNSAPCSQAAYCDSCNGGACDACGPGRCTMRSTWNAYGMNWCDRCGPIGTAARLKVPGARALCCCCTTKAFPDSGWAPPARIPVNYTNRGFQSWYGNSGPFAGGAPMVYQPNDTAQLGFSYSNAPTWRRDPSKIPPVPIPSNFHTRACPRDGRCGPFCSIGCNACSTCSPMAYGGTIQGAGCPTCNNGFVSAMPGQAQVIMLSPTPQPQLSVRNSTKPQPSAMPVQKRQVRTVSNQTRKPSVRQARPASLSNAAPQKRSATGRPVTRRNVGRRQPAKKSSGGWFGLPSLSEMKF